MTNEARFAALADAIQRVEDELVALYAGPDLTTTSDIPRELRWKLLAMGSSMNDHSFWIERIEDEPVMYRATEIESGVSAASAPTPQEAMENYWHRIYF